MYTLGLVLLTSLFAADPYAEAWETAVELEAAGRLDEAVAVLEDAAATWPQDYALAMRLGALCVEAGDRDAARRWYRQAVDLSGGAPEAKQALARLSGSTRIEGLVAGTLYLGGDWSSGLSAGAWVEHVGPRGVVVQGGYRYATLFPRPTSSSGVLAAARDPDGPHGGRGEAGPSDPGPGDPGPGDPGPGPGDGTGDGDGMGNGDGMGPGSGGGMDPPWTSDDPMFATSEHVAHLGLGYGRPRGGVLVQGIGILGGSGDLAGAVAVSARWSPWGDLVLSGTWSAWPDARIVAGDLGWRMPLTRWLSLVPGGAGQWVEGTWLGNGRLSVLVTAGPATLLAGGRYGTSYRPILLEPLTVYDLPGRLGPGAWGQARFALGHGWQITAGWEWTRLQSDTDFDAHSAWLVFGHTGP